MPKLEDELDGHLSAIAEHTYKILDLLVGKYAEVLVHYTETESGPRSEDLKGQVRQIKYVVPGPTFAPGDIEVVLEGCYYTIQLKKVRVLDEDR